jgi:serine/threonine protein kinase/Cdc6-like AAA superfamily ATPase
MTTEIMMTNSTFREWWQDNWMKLVFASCLGLIFGSVIGVLKVGIQNPVSAFALGRIGAAINLVMLFIAIRTTEDMRCINSLAITILIEALLILVLGLFGAGLSVLWQWFPQNTSVNIWDGAKFLAITGQWIGTGIAIARSRGWFTGDQQDDSIALATLLGPAVAIVVVLFFQSKLTAYALIGLLTGLIVGFARFLVYILWEGRRLLDWVITKVRQNRRHIPDLLIVACIGLAGGIIREAIRVQAPLENIFWSMGISGLCFEGMFLVFLIILHNDTQQRLQILLRAISVILGFSIALTLIGVILKFYLSLTVPIHIYLLAIGQWGLFGWLLYSILKDLSRGKLGLIPTLPKAIIGSAVFIFVGVWSIRHFLLVVYGLDEAGLVIGSFVLIKYLEYANLDLRGKILSCLKPGQEGGFYPWKDTSPIFSQRSPIPSPSILSGGSSTKSDFSITIRLSPDFKFVHEPLGESQTSQFIGRSNQINRLADRIVFSNGGAFLITGYRGVGKTSFVKQVIKEVKSQLSEFDIHVIDVWMNLARPMDSSELMHHIVRGFYDRLKSENLLEDLNENFREDLLSAYQRTSYNISQKTTRSKATSIGLSKTLSAQLMKIGASLSREEGRQEEQEMAFLGYDDKAAEYDVIRLFSSMAQGFILEENRGALDRFMGVRRPNEALKQDIKVIVIFDEMDKLEEFTTQEGNGKPVVDKMLHDLKNVFTTSNIAFVFIAGRRMQERWMEEVGRGDSLYESVFAYNLYLPCMWSETEEIFQNLVCGPLAQDQFGEDIKAYLRFKGRGIPRRTVREVNAYVKWGNRPYLAFDGISRTRVEFYAQLQGVLEDNYSTVWRNTYSDVREQKLDKERLGQYYLVDWVLSQGQRKFTKADVLAAATELRPQISPDQKTTASTVDGLLEILLKHNYIRKFKRAASDLQVEDLSTHDELVYALTHRVFDMLEDFSTHFEGEAFAAAPVELTQVKDYTIIEAIAKGGMGEVYRAVDTQTSRQVALKVLLPRLAKDSAGRERFEREIDLVSKLRHPNIVRVLGKGEVDKRPFMVMEYVDGPNLDRVITLLGTLDSNISMQIASRVASAFEYIHKKGIIRGDIKPSNVILSKQGKVYVTDLGIAKAQEDQDKDRTLTDEGVIIGTPIYMAPEQARSERVDSRADIYSLGVLLYEMVTGTPPFEGSTVAVLHQHVSKKPTPPTQMNPDVSEELGAVILKCLQKDPDLRFQTMEEFVNSLPTYTQVDLSHIAEEVLEVTDQQESKKGEVLIPEGVAVQTQQILPAAPVSDLKAASYDRPSSPPPYQKRKVPRSDILQSLSLIQSQNLDSRINLIFLEKNQTSTVGLDGKQEIKIGRQPENDITLNSPRVSREHACIRLERGSYILYDLAGSSGTYVNGNRVHKRKLSDEDNLVIGDVEMLFVDQSKKPRGGDTRPL